MKETIRTIRSLDGGHFHGQMVEDMLGNGQMESNTVWELTQLKAERLSMGNGEMGSELDGCLRTSLNFDLLNFINSVPWGFGVLVV